MATAYARSGQRLSSPLPGGGLASAEPDAVTTDIVDPPGKSNVVVTIGPPENPAVKAAARVGGTELTTDPVTGNVVVNFNPRPATKALDPAKFDANLAENIDEDALSQIAMDVIEGIEADDQSRRQQIEQYNSCMDLLALRIESKGQAGGADGQSISNVRHPVLLESVMLFQSASYAEMLPAGGPCKVQNEGGESLTEDSLAYALEQDMNWYLTKVATEYYPGTDRANFYLGYGGTIFKKVYKCPQRRRPVSEPVYIPDLIVSNDATDLQNAQRVTHVLYYTRAEVKRMQAMRIWRKVELSSPVSQPSTSQTKEGTVIGISPLINRLKDIPRAIYECYTDLWLGEHGIRSETGQPEGLPIPYRVTIDRVSRRILEIRRDWKQGDEMFRRRKHFVKFGLVPGLGFYDLGYLHLIGNQTKVLTAVWRILCDAGMFNNFPGGVMLEGARLKTNIIRPNPGEFIPVNGGAQQDLGKAFSPFPYKEPSAVLLQMAQQIAEDARKITNAVTMETGEGRTNIPVGTIMAQIEQQTQNLQAVHKRLHRAQSEEFELMLDLFREDPTMLWKFFGDKEPARQWMTANEFQDIHLRAASDPNIPAQVHRVMLAVALTMLAAQPQNMGMYDQEALNRRVLQMINIQNPDELLLTAEKRAAMAQGAPPPPPDPKVVAAQIEQQTKQAAIQANQQGDQMDLQADQEKAQATLKARQMESTDRAADRQNRLAIAKIKENTELLRQRHDASVDHAQLHLDRADSAHQQVKDHHDMAMQRHGLAQDAQAQAHQQQIDHLGLAQEAQNAQAAREQQMHQQTIDRASLDNERQKVAQAGLNGSAGLGAGQP